MQVKLYALLRQAAGTKIMDVEVHPDMSIGDVLSEVTGRYPVLVKYIWEEQGVLSERAHVFVNGVNIHHLDGTATSIKPEDHVDIFPPIVGG